MANAIVTFKIMPNSPEVSCETIGIEAEKIMKDNGAKGETKIQINPVAFGLKEVLALGMFEVGDDSFDVIAEKMLKINNVNSAEVAKMDLAMG